MLQPRQKYVQPFHRLRIRIPAGSSCQSERIYMVKYRFFIPCHNVAS
jgi:hypothetical protein